MVKINGIDTNAAGKTLTAYLTETNYDPKRVAVLRNDEIVSKTLFTDTVLQDGDTVEIVSFVGGG